MRWLLLLVLLSACRPATPESLQMAIWYWNSELEFRESDLNSLRRMGMQEVYIRAGQFGYAGRPMLVRTVRVWRSPAELRVHLVYNFTPEMIRAFTQIEVDAAAKAISDSVSEQMAEAERAGLRVAGIQLDFDVPTGSLERYSEFLHLVRGRFPRHLLSITTLGDWIGRPQYNRLVEQVDFHVPQLYGFQVPRRFDRINSISDPASIRSYLRQLANSPKTYWVGLRTYGYCLVYDERGELVSLRTDLALSRLVRVPELKLVSTTEDLHGSAERLATFEVLADTYLGTVSLRRGWRLVVDEPTPESLRRCLEVVKREGRGRLAGVLFFRYPQPDEELVLSLAQLEAVLSGRELESAPSLQTRQVTDWVELELHNGSERASRLRSGSVEVEVALSGLLEVDRGDFESVECFLGSVPASARLADRCLLQASYLGRGATLRARLRLAKKGSIVKRSVKVDF